MSEYAQLEIDHQGLAILILGKVEEKVTVLSHALMEELELYISKLEGNSQINGLVIRGSRPDMFAAGADIQAIKDVTDPAQGTNLARKGQILFTRIAKLPYPTVAAIGGPCLGGGLELALACQFRVAADHPKTKIGLPEVRLGILPGFGGTQRLPRLIGLPAALPAMLTGKMYDAKGAARVGIVDDAVSPYQFLDYAKQIALKKIKKTPRKSMRLLIEKNPLARTLIAKQARKQVWKETKGHYPAALKIIESAVSGLGQDFEQGLIHEAKLLGELIVSPESKALTSLFFLSEAAKRHAERAKDLPAIQQAAVVGCGVMGSGIATVMVNKDLTVRMRDLNAEFVARGINQARKYFLAGVKKRRLKPYEMQQRMDRLIPVLPPAKVTGSALIIEAVAEKIEVKNAVFQEIAREVDEDAILATNTSSLSVTELQAHLPNPKRVVGIHFFNPVEKMPLIEIIKGKQTSPTVIAQAAAFALQLGKTPIVVKDVPGFLVNRILAPYLNEAAHLLLEGVTISALDAAAQEFGMPMGPIALLDEVGIDIAAHAAKTLHDAYGARMQGPDLLQKLIAAGRLGKKNGKGFYIHSKGQRKLDSSISKKLGLPNPKPLATHEIVDRLILPIVNESLRCLEEEVVESKGDLDLGSVMGFGFAPFRGGVLRYAESVGSQPILEKMQRLAKMVGPRFTPAPLLEKIGRQNGSFLD